MNIQGIADNVQTLLTTMTKGGDPLFKTVLPGEPEENEVFTGYPSAVHYYTDGESQYATVSQNRRIYIYNVDITLVTPSGMTTTAARSQAYDLIDRTIDRFDKSIDLSDTALSLPRACDIMRPAPSSLIPVETEAGLGLMMTIRLYCEADVSFRNS